ncbi:hypothetical protein L1987_22550 [Smallanthus sonchifolius]|uniref:Uncharacterized protein n=1 Tax=Smallanthus sonchifolius TaxID=185202 RepID=A0ACB9IF51_9ASTR|nr:hypothetical protein L1987_22550 [Smallanthus sonchifolius]
MKRRRRMMKKRVIRRIMRSVGAIPFPPLIYTLGFPNIGCTSFEALSQLLSPPSHWRSSSFICDTRSSRSSYSAFDNGEHNAKLLICNIWPYAMEF